MIEITLSPAELQHAANVGAQRHIEAIFAGLENKHGAKGAKDLWTLHIEGACGELAFARAVDQQWEGRLNNFKEADFGDRVQVRTRTRHSYDLIVRWGDSDDHLYVLVTGRAPTFRVHGWIKGQDAKRRSWLHDYGGHGPAFFVPSTALQPIRPAGRERAA